MSELDNEKIIQFKSGWTRELEKLVADWADKAQCYRWMHDKSHHTLGAYNQYMVIPVIILSTLSGTANFGLDTIFTDPASQNKKYATLGIGSIGIITGIITTIANFLRYAQLSEAHSLASISWSKFSRVLTIELSLHPRERTDVFSFLKMFRAELDRLIEQSPVIPEFIIHRFKKEFNAKMDIKRPEITGALEHAAVFDNKQERLKQIAVEAALSLAHKKKVLKDLVLSDIDTRIHSIVDSKTISGVYKRKESIIPYFPIQKDVVSYVPKLYVGELKRKFAEKRDEEINTEEKKEESKEEPKTDIEIVVK
jgi:hypothetical protein